MALSLTPMSAERALRLLNGLAYTTGTKAPTKLSAKGLTQLAKTCPDQLYVINRSMFGQEHGLGPDDECSLADLKARGAKSVLLRANHDRDLLEVLL